MPVNTKLTTIFRSNANSDQHTTTESFHVNIPKGQKYYLRWVRSSEGPFDWGNDILQLQEESFKVSYIAPATNYWNLTQYTSGSVNAGDKVRIMNVDRLKKLGIKNNFNIQQGIERTFDWYKKNYKKKFHRYNSFLENK